MFSERFWKDKSYSMPVKDDAAPKQLHMYLEIALSFNKSAENSEFSNSDTFEQLRGDFETSEAGTKSTSALHDNITFHLLFLQHVSLE